MGMGDAVLLMFIVLVIHNVIQFLRVRRLEERLDRLENNARGAAAR
jgi:hypothetical protein